MLKQCTIAALLLGAAAAHAGQALTVRDAWIRHIPGDRPMAGYFLLENQGDGERSLVGAASPGFAMVEIHESVEEDDMTGMRPVDAVAVPAGGRVAFEAGGYHLMLMQRQQDFEVGDEIPVTLEFADGAARDATFTVKPAWQE